MCGVFGYVGHRQTAAEIVFNELKMLEYRGYDSWGVAVSAGQELLVKKQVGKIGAATVSELPASQLAIGHTRWATHGGVTTENAHPHLDCTGTLALVHNGIVENHVGLKADLVRQGHTFLSETDSEVIAHLLEENLKHMPLLEAFRTTFNQLDGLNAVAVISAHEERILAARNGSSLVLGFGDGENYLSSDPAALLALTKEVYFLENGQLAEISSLHVRVSDVKSGQTVEFTKQILDWDVSQTQLGQYEHFMLKEIYEQPAIIANIASTGVENARQMAAEFELAHNVYLVGCGTAAYAGLIGSYLFSKIAHRHVNSAVGSEFKYQLDFLDHQSLALALSQSGETMDLLEPLQQAKARGATVLALVNTLGSSLYRLADHKYLLGAGPERAVASTKAFTAKVAHLVLIAHALAGTVELGKRALESAVSSVQELFQPASIERIQALAKKLAQAEHLFVIGRGLSYPTSLECALKIKEVSYIHAEGLAAGELKHGTLALIEAGVACLVLLPQDETYEETLNAAMEIKARGGLVIGVSSHPHPSFDYYLPFADAGDASSIPMVVIAQLLAYYLTLGRQLDPDKPRNLAKSVTVK